MKNMLRIHWLARLVLAGLAGGHSWSSESVYRFDDEADSGVKVVSSMEAPIRTAGGNPGGFLALTDAKSDQSTFVFFPDRSGGKAVESFTVSLDARIGNSAGFAPADGFSISFASPFDPIFSAKNPGHEMSVSNSVEFGTRTGLVISFNSFVYEDMADGPAIEGLAVRLDNRTLLRHPLPVLNGAPNDPASLQTGPLDQKNPGKAEHLGWQPLRVDLNPKGQLSVAWKNSVLVDRLETGFRPRRGRWVIASRTGGANQNHHLDNISISEQLLSDNLPFLDFRSSISGISLGLHHHAETQLNARVAELTINDLPIDWNLLKLARISPNEVTLSYDLPFPGAFRPKTEYRVRLDLKTPAGETVSLAAKFRHETSIVRLPENAREEPREGVASGFKVRAWQLATLKTKRDINQPWNLEWAESALQGLAGENVIAATNAVRRLETINLNTEHGRAAGDTLPNEAPMDRLTGKPGRSANNLNAEFEAWIEFPGPGVYPMAILSNDGYRLAVGERPTRQYLEIVSPAAAAGPVASMSCGDGESPPSRLGTGYGPPMPVPPLEAEAVFAEPRTGCETLSNPEALKGKIAIVYRGECYFTVKTRLAQKAGSIAVVIINNSESYPGVMDAKAEDIVIPSVQVPASVGRLLEQHRDGLRLSLGKDQSVILSELNSGGPPVVNRFALVVARPGWYPIRLVYSNVHGPGNLEWYSLAGEHPVLINDRTHPKALRAFSPP